MSVNPTGKKIKMLITCTYIVCLTHSIELTQKDKMSVTLFRNQINSIKMLLLLSSSSTENVCVACFKLSLQLTLTI